MVNGTNAGSLLDYALSYARDGLQILPLRPMSKEPGTLRGFKAATTDLRQVQAWWDANPRYNIGCVPPPGIIVLDVDPRNGGDTALQKLIDEHGPLPSTPWVARTGSGGWHYWFRAESIEVYKTLCPGVDLKIGATGYVVMPPSIHKTGNTYQWQAAQ